MKLFELFIGNTRRYIAAADHEDAYKQGTDPTKHPDISYLPFTVTEVTVPGYEIVLLDPMDEYFAAKQPSDPPADSPEQPAPDGIPTEREALKAWLTERGVEFKPQFGDKRLLELAKAWQAKQEGTDEA